MVVAATLTLAIIVGVSIASTNWILIVGLGILPILLLRPRELSLGCYVFLLPFDSITKVGPGGQTLTTIAGAAVAAVWLSTGLLKRDLRRPPRQALWWTLFVSWGAVTVLWAIEPQPAAIRLSTAVSLLAVFLVVLSTNISRDELRNIALFVVAGACAAALFTSYQFYRGVDYHGAIRGSLMVGGTGADPNYFAASLLLPLSLAVNGFLTPRKWLARTAWLGATVIIAFGILVTMSRGALVAVTAMIFFYMYTRQVSRRLVIPLVGIFVALAFALPGNFLTRLESAGETGGAGRTVVWQGGLVAFTHYPLVGSGLNTFSDAYQKYLGGAPIYHGILVSGAHNSYLETAVELGTIGFLLVMTAFVTQLLAASRLRKLVPHQVASTIIAYEAGCYAILVAAFFIGVFWEKWFWMAWMLLALAVRTSEPDSVVVSAPLPKPVSWPWTHQPVGSAPGLRLR